MRILADENVDRPIARWLREQGHDVVEARLRGAGRTWPLIDESGIHGHLVTVKNEQVRRRPLPVEPS